MQMDKYIQLEYGNQNCLNEGYKKSFPFALKSFFLDLSYFPFNQTHINVNLPTSVHLKEL